MIEPRAWMLAVEESGEMVVHGRPYRSEKSAMEDLQLPLERGQKAEVWYVYDRPVTDVLAALRDTSEAMLQDGARAYEAHLDKVKKPHGHMHQEAMQTAFLAMLDQFERDQGSAA